MIQLLDAVAYMHSRGFLHRDLKSSNLLYSNKGQLCVCDFGLARKYESAPTAPYTFEVVTLWCKSFCCKQHAQQHSALTLSPPPCSDRAPELLLGLRHYGPAIDNWSVGCIFAEMLTGEALFPGQGEIDELHKIFSVLGAPTELVWPAYKSLVKPEYQRRLSWKLPSRNRLREVFPVAAFATSLALSDTGVHLLAQLLHMDPTQRMAAKDAMRHAWLAEELPRATPEAFMPTFASSNAQ
jgi:cell division cycle 2-like protein